MTSDGGLILLRELDERFDMSGLIGEHFVDSRTGRNTQFLLADDRLVQYDPEGLSIW